MNRIFYFKTVFFIIILFSGLQVDAQHNFLGENKDFILNHFKNDPEYSIEIDTINKNTTLITCKTFNQYPYYTYEIDLMKDACTSYAFISKDRNILDAYVDVLEHIGEVVECDSTKKNITYKVSANDKNSYFSIKQPFFNSDSYSKRGIFYIMVTEQSIKKEK